MALAQQGNNNADVKQPQNEQRWRTNGNQAGENDFIGTRNEAPLRLNTSGNERLRITPEGNIGVNNSNPIERLDVNGSIRVTDYLQFEQFRNEENETQLLYLDKAGRTNVMSPLMMLYYNMNNDCVLDILNPTSSVKGGGNVSAKSDCSEDIMITWASRVSDDCVPILHTATEEACKAARIGVGTKVPITRMDIRGSTSISNILSIGTPSASEFNNINSDLTVFSTDSSNDLIRLHKRLNNRENVFKVDQNGKVFTHGLNIGAVDNFSNAALHIRANTSSTSNYSRLMVIESGGNKVLQLNNNGLLRTREVKVDTENWPDYVFAKDYELMPLKNLKTFIEENGHLPKMTPAIEIETEGLNLGEVQKLQMEKIEELTLYTIEQQEQLDEQKKLLEEQRELIEMQRKALEEMKNNQSK